MLFASTRRIITVQNLTKKNFSSRSRVITDEPALNYYIDYAKKNFNVQKSEIILLVSKKIEKRIYEVLRRGNNLIKDISVLKGYYYMNSTQRLILKLNKALLNNRKIVNVNIDISF